MATFDSVSAYCISLCFIALDMSAHAEREGKGGDRGYWAMQGDRMVARRDVRAVGKVDDEPRVNLDIVCGGHLLGGAQSSRWCQIWIQCAISNLCYLVLLTLVLYLSNLIYKCRLRVWPICSAFSHSYLVPVWKKCLCQLQENRVICLRSCHLRDSDY